MGTMTDGTKVKGVQQKGNRFYFVVQERGKSVWSKKSYSSWQEASLVREKYLPKLPPKPGGGEFSRTWARFIKEKEYCSDSTIRSYATIFNCHLEPAFGSFMLVDITRSILREFFLNKAKEKNPITANTCKEKISVFFSWAYDLELIEKHPCLRMKNIPVSEEKKFKHVILEGREKQLFEIVDNFEPLFKYAILVAAYSGARKNTVFALKWEDINMKEKTINYERRHNRKGGISMSLKNPRSKVKVEMIEELMGVLNEWREICPKSIWVFPHNWNSKNPYHAESFSYIWKEKLKSYFPAGFRFHDLKHFFSSAILTEKYNMNTVQRMYFERHATDSMAIHYAHLSKAGIAEALQGKQS